MKTIIFLFLFSFSTITSVQAETGETWLSTCEADSFLKQSYCFGYLRGLKDMYSSIREELLYFQKMPLITCLPPNMTLDQMVKIMRKYLNDNPEQLHRKMTTLYQIKMMKTFPCKKTK